MLNKAKPDAYLCCESWISERNKIKKIHDEYYGLNPGTTSTKAIGKGIGIILKEGTYCIEIPELTGDYYAAYQIRNKDYKFGIIAGIFHVSPSNKK
jgi:hypothetical protein